MYVTYNHNEMALSGQEYVRGHLYQVEMGSSSNVHNKIPFSLKITAYCLIWYRQIYSFQICMLTPVKM